MLLEEKPKRSVRILVPPRRRVEVKKGMVLLTPSIGLQRVVEVKSEGVVLEDAMRNRWAGFSSRGGSAHQSFLCEYEWFAKHVLSGRWEVVYEPS